MRSLSMRVVQNYRNKAKKCPWIPFDVLKVRLNCLIDAVSPEHIRKFSDRTDYRFNSCIISVFENIITDIRWVEDDGVKASSFEIGKLLDGYLTNGLNKSGTKFVEVKRNAVCNSTK